MCYINSTTLRTVTFFVFFHFSFVLISCSDSATEPPPKPAGYQEDIPWPSLADAPWPMYRHDPQNTGRTSSIGALHGEIAFEIDTLDTRSGFAIGSDSTSYFNFRDWESGSDANYGIIAMNSSGKEKWKFSFSFDDKRTPCSPLIAKDGTIYVGTSYPAKEFFALNRDGSLKWKIVLDLSVHQSGINIDKDGNIYLVALDYNSQLIVINKKGFIEWTLNLNQTIGRGLSSMSFSPDGKTLYIPGEQYGHALVAVDIEEHTIKWIFGQNSSVIYGNPPLVDTQGNIYVVSKKNEDQADLYCLNDMGEIKWSYGLGHPGRVQGYNSYTMDKYGNLYLGSENLISLTWNGKERWQIKNVNIASPIVIDGNNRIYFNKYNDGQNGRFISIDMEGNIIYDIEYPEVLTSFNYSLAIGYSQIWIPTVLFDYLAVIK